MNTPQNNIKALRLSKKIVQEELKDALGWNHVSRVSHYEAGKRKGTIEECRDITTALNKLGVECTLDDVFPPHAANDENHSPHAA
jgi:putative transcriptional regulator